MHKRKLFCIGRLYIRIYEQNALNIIHRGIFMHESLYNTVYYRQGLTVFRAFLIETRYNHTAYGPRYNLILCGTVYPYCMIIHFSFTRS